MTKTEIMQDIASALSTEDRPVSAKLVGEILDDFSGLVIDTARAGDAIELAALGKFTGKAQAAREARNPHSGETVQVAAKTVLKFTPGARVKRQVNGEE